MMGIMIAEKEYQEVVERLDRFFSAKPKTPKEAQELLNEERLFCKKLTKDQLELYKRMKFERLYGLNSEVQQNKVTIDLLRKYPGLLTFSRLKKSRSRMIADAILFGEVVKGNLSVRCRKLSVKGESADVIIFSYRGTDILAWHLDKDAVVDVHAGRYEDTMSTFNQRKEARKAIDEFRREVLKWS